MSLPDLSTMRVEALVYDTELRFLSPNMTCDLSLDAVPGRRWKGRIVSLTNVASRKGFASQHKVFRAVIEMEKADLGVMKPGMTVRIEVPISLASQVIMVPREYLGVDNRGGYFVRKGTDAKTASVQPVQVGTYNDRLVEITSGLSVADRLLPVQKLVETKR
jgi:multidrug efflux pump subunit AcrA (membrane-fusion protein)